jgi:hypothetical protein
MARWTARTVRALPWPLGEQSRRRAIRERLARLPAGGYGEAGGTSAASRVPPQRDDEPSAPAVTEGPTPTEV